MKKKVVILFEGGIPAYRRFLLAHLASSKSLDLTVLHNGKGTEESGALYKQLEVNYVGSPKCGTHIGVWKHLINADIIIASYNLRVLSCWLPCLVFGSKWIFWGKGLGSSENRIVLGLRRLTALKARKILVYNERKRAELIERTGIHRDKVIAYQNSVFIEKPFNSGSVTKNYFLYFGRLQERKGLDDLLRQYAEYVKTTGAPKYKLRFVGNGPLHDRLTVDACRFGISEYVEFYPGVYDEDGIAYHFKHAAIYVSPFNVGLGVVHSLGYGVPVLTCKQPQVGPEYHYLNSANSIVVDSVSDLTSIFVRLEDTGHKLYNSSYAYYRQYLHHSIMLERFTQVLMEAIEGK